MLRFRKVFGVERSVIIGMIHLKALPGTPMYSGSVSSIIEAACKDSEVYNKSNIDAVLIENMHDVPYVQAHHLGPEITSVVTLACAKVREVLSKHIKCGVQVLAGGNKEALAIALATNLDFIRAEGFVFSHMADEGFTDACAGSLLRYRKAIDADNVLVFTDIKKKHSSHVITNDISLEETAEAAQFFLSDGVIVTGSATGQPADVSQMKSVKKKVNLPVLVGSGVTEENLQDYIGADGLIIGSHFKQDGKWQNDVCVKRVHSFLDKFKKLASQK